MGLRKPLRRLGKKGRCWERVRAELKKQFEAIGVTQCELGYNGCWKTNGLQFCHSRKRRNITTEEGLREVVIGCPNCHPVLELLPEAEMCRIVREIIAARSVAESRD